MLAGDLRKKPGSRLRPRKQQEQQLMLMKKNRQTQSA